MNSTLNIRTAVAASLLASMVLPAVAGDNDSKDVKKASEGELLTLTGKVASVSGDRFTLDYGQKDIVVEMDDYDWFSENALVSGDRVTVTGRMDQDFHEARKIEASSVYVDSLNEYFYASAADEEEGLYVQVLNDTLEDDEWVSLTGTVASIKGDNIMIDTGTYEYDVDANGLAYNPLDATGEERIEVGERIVVFGRMDDADLFDDREIEASSIATLSSAS